MLDRPQQALHPVKVLTVGLEIGVVGQRSLKVAAGRALQGFHGFGIAAVGLGYKRVKLCPGEVVSGVNPEGRERAVQHEPGAQVAQRLAQVLKAPCEVRQPRGFCVQAVKVSALGRAERLRCAGGFVIGARLDHFGGLHRDDALVFRAVLAPLRLGLYALALLLRLELLALHVPICSANLCLTHAHVQIIRRAHGLSRFEQVACAFALNLVHAVELHPEVAQRLDPAIDLCVRGVDGLLVLAHAVAKRQPYPVPRGQDSGGRGLQRLELFCVRLDIAA